MKPQPLAESWQVRMLGTRLLGGGSPIRPAEVGDGLRAALLARENVLEDANYQKVAPNRYIVEVSQENYNRNYQPLEEQILAQWKEKLLKSLMTANSRQGRMDYRFAGPLKIQIRPVTDLKNGQARILCRVQVEESGSRSAAPLELPAWLESSPDGLRWPLHLGMVTIGRDVSCEIHLDSPAVREKLLVSSRHAYLYCQERSVHLYDGTPEGQPSLNGTFVNLRRVPPGGIELRDGDLILLAALDPNRPSPETPGVAALIFRQESG
jgi:hypothetical protein